MARRATAAQVRVNELPAADPLARARTERSPQTGPSARDLQREVAEAVAAGAFGPGERWSQRRTLGFILVTCTTFWSLVALLAHSLF